MSREPIELFIWDHPVSSYAQKVRIALREKKIPFISETPRGGGTGNAANMDPSFSEGNMHLEMPLLIDDDFKVSDSTIILEYLEDKYPNTPLLPKSARERARARMIEELCDSKYEALNWAMGEINVFERAGAEQAVKLNEQAKYQVKQIHSWLTEQLGSADWFGGEQFGWADVCVWPMIARSTSYGIEPRIGTPLRNWFERAKNRDSVKAVYEDFVAATSGPNKSVEALKQGVMKRQYRDHRLEWLVKSGAISVIEDGLKKNNIRFSWPYAQE